MVYTVVQISALGIGLSPLCAVFFCRKGEAFIVDKSFIEKSKEPEFGGYSIVRETRKEAESEAISFPRNQPHYKVLK